MSDDAGSTREPPVRMAAALRYTDGMDAPVVVAKGRGLVADEIVRRAAESGVAIQVSSNLAALLMHVEIDRAIPPQLFRAVAELLAWIYRLEGRAHDGAVARLPAP
jgi:flagellar biosynthesis protein